MRTVEDLITWLRATIEGDLATARAATQGDWAAVGVSDYEGPPYPGMGERGREWGVDDVAEGMRRVDALHVVEQQPRDTITRCEAELAILDEHAVTTTSAIGEDLRRIRVEVCQVCGNRSGVPCRTARLLAYGYRHRPGWQEGWAP